MTLTADQLMQASAKFGISYVQVAEINVAVKRGHPTAAQRRHWGRAEWDCYEALKKDAPPSDKERMLSLLENSDVHGDLKALFREIIDHITNDSH